MMTKPSQEGDDRERDINFHPRARRHHPIRVSAARRDSERRLVPSLSNARGGFALGRDPDMLMMLGFRVGAAVRRPSLSGNFFLVAERGMHILL